MSLTGSQRSLLEKLFGPAFGPEQSQTEKTNYISAVINDASSRTNINQIRGVTQAGSTGSGIPKHVTNVSAIMSSASTGATSKIVVTFRRDPTDNTFSGVTVYAKGYQGNQSPTQVGFGTDAPLTVILNNTGESVSLIVQATGNGGSAPLATAPSCGIKLPVNPNGGFGTSTITNLTTSQLPASAAPELDYPDPTKCFFGRTNVDLLGTGVQSGDPQVIWDAANNQWVMLWYELTSPASTWIATASSLAGPWTGATHITSLDTYHKTRILVDTKNNPVLIGGFYYAVSVLASGGPSGKQIYLFKQSTIQGNSWVIQNGGSPIVPKSGSGGAGVYDDFFTDQPEFVYDTKTGKVYIWYTGAPGVSQSDFGLAERMLLAIAPSIAGPYTKQSGYVLGPSSSSGTWDFGLVEGPQVRVNADGTFFMAYIGGSTRPASSGDEPSTTLWGFATSPSLNGPWTKVPGPFIQLSGLPQWPTGVPNSGSVGTIVDSTDIWRPYCVLDPITNEWLVFYNTGNGSSPTEKITVARQGVLSFANGAYVGGLLGAGGYILAMTTSEQQIPGSKVFLRPGKYRVSYSINLFADLGGTSPKLDIAFFLRPNGTKAGQWARPFLGSYAFENDDYTIEDYISVAAPAGPTDGSQYVDCSIQVVGGTPTAQSYLRNLRVLVEQI